MASIKPMNHNREWNMASPKTAESAEVGFKIRSILHHEPIDAGGGGVSLNSKTSLGSNLTEQARGFLDAAKLPPHLRYLQEAGWSGHEKPSPNVSPVGQAAAENSTESKKAQTTQNVLANQKINVSLSSTRLPIGKVFM